ncbi:hypothetical protein IWW57_000363 [Coemansia sp. S610]|nr:hypothetical protein IWW57_000363 [Coemansia sp. S610]
MCSVEVSGALKPGTKPGTKPKPPKNPNAEPCDPNAHPNAECLTDTTYRYCDGVDRQWVTMDIEPDMYCDANRVLHDSSASAPANGPAALALGAAVAIWQFL